MAEYSDTAVETSLTLSVASGATSIQVGSVSGFPVSFPYFLAIDRGTASLEVVRVTAASGNTLTVVRGESTTSALAHSAGAAVEHVAPASHYSDTDDHVAATSDVHGVTGSLNTAITGKQPLDATLTALAGLDATGGLVAQTAEDTFTKRQVVSTDAAIVVANGDGVSGNPSLSISEANLSGIPQASVTDLATDIAALDTRLDTLESDVGPTSMTPATGWTATRCDYQHIGGKIVHIEFQLERTGAAINVDATGNATDTDLFTLPASIRPASTSFWAGVNLNGGACGGYFLTSGNVRLASHVPSVNIDTGNDICGSITYFL